MKDETEKTYSTEEVKKSMDEYIDSSAARLSLRLKTAWKKQTSLKPPLAFYDKAKV